MKQLVKVSEIKANPNNPRTIDPKKFRKLKASIKKFPKMLEKRPLVVDEDWMVLGGNMRLAALTDLGIEQTWIDTTEDWTQEEKDEFVIKDNISYGVWDWKQIHTNWDPIVLSKWGMDVEPMTAGQKQAKEDNFKIPKVIDTDLKLGDHIEIGPHRIICGDSTDPNTFKMLFLDDRASLILTDPPYDVSYKATGNKYQDIENDDLRDSALEDFLFECFSNLQSFSTDNAASYIWYASKNHITFEEALIRAGFEVKHQLIWNKGMMLSRSDYHLAHEPMLYCKKAGQKTRWFGDRSQKTILNQRRTEIDKLKKSELVAILQAALSESTTWEIDRDQARTYEHPTQKPVALAGRAINNSSKPGEIVVDCFGGSGSTMVACHQLDRKCYAIEYSPEYCQLHINRMKALDPALQILINGKLM